MGSLINIAQWNLKKKQFFSFQGELGQEKPEKKIFDLNFEGAIGFYQMNALEERFLVGTAWVKWL